MTLNPIRRRSPVFEPTEIQQAVMAAAGGFPLTPGSKDSALTATLVVAGVAALALERAAVAHRRWPGCLLI